MKKATLKTPSIQSLDRGLFILETVAKSTDPVTLGQLTDLLAIDRSSVFRLANTLKRRGFLAVPDGRKEYILGPSIWRLSRQCAWSNMLITLCRERLKFLAIRTGETTHLAVREGKQALFIDHCASNGHIIVVWGQTGEFAPLYCTAHGKALLADCGAAELKAIFGPMQFQQYTASTIVSIDQLAKACVQIKADGFAYDDGEYNEEVHCLAAPIRDSDGAIVSCIGISAPVARFPKERVEMRGRCVKSRAKSALFSAPKMPGSSRLPGERLWPVLLGVFALALSLRCLYLWQIRAAPFFDLRIGDAEAYHLWAQRIAGGDWRGEGVFYQSPVYPYFPAVIYRLLDDSAPARFSVSTRAFNRSSTAAVSRQFRRGHPELFEQGSAV